MEMNVTQSESPNLTPLLSIQLEALSPLCNWEKTLGSCTKKERFFRERYSWLYRQQRKEEAMVG